MIRIIIPSRTDDFLEQLFSSLEVSQHRSLASVTVADNGLSAAFHKRWQDATYCHVPVAPFCFSQAINMAVDAAQPDSADLLILNDDTRMVTPHWKSVAEELLRRPDLAEFGMISFSVDGGVGNSEQKVGAPIRNPMLGLPAWETQRTVAFIAILIRRMTWDLVGRMDESFTGYGWEDNDYCNRVREKGWKVGVTPRLVVKHGHGHAHSSSFLRYHGARKWNEMNSVNFARYQEKWGKPS